MPAVESQMMHVKVVLNDGQSMLMLPCHAMVQFVIVRQSPRLDSSTATLHPVSHVPRLCALGTYGPQTVCCRTMGWYPL